MLHPATRREGPRFLSEQAVGTISALQRYMAANTRSDGNMNGESLPILAAGPGSVRADLTS